jgi:hypothetical protein
MKKQRCTGCNKLLPFTDEFFNKKTHKRRCLKCRKIYRKQYAERRRKGTTLVIGSMEHRAHMSAIMRARCQTPEARARQSAVMRKRWQNPAARAQHSAAMRKRWQNPEYRAMHNAAINNPECRARKSAAVRKRFQNPEERKRHGETIRNSPRHQAAMKNPEVRARQSAAHRERWKNPEARVRASAAQRKRFQNPEERARMKVARNSPQLQATMKSAEYKARMSKAVYNSPRFQAVMNSLSYRTRQYEASSRNWSDPAYRARAKKRAEAVGRLRAIGAEILRGNNAPMEQRRNQSYCYWQGYEFAKRSGLRNDPLFKPLIKDD